MAKFAKGNPGGPGRPKGTARILWKPTIHAFFDANPDEPMKIVAAVVEQAKQGNAAALRFLAERTDGPASRIYDFEKIVANMSNEQLIWLLQFLEEGNESAQLDWDSQAS